MKRTLCLLGLALALVSPIQAAEQATVTVTVKSYRALTNAVVQVVDAVAPGSGTPILDDLRAGLGVSELKGVDLDRPWQIGFWVEMAGGAPNISVRIPTADFAAFTGGLDDGSPLQGAQEREAIQQVGQYANVWIAGMMPSETAKAAHDAWKANQIGSVDGAVAVDIALSESLRQQLVGGLAMVKMTVTGAMAQQGQAVPGVDAAAMAELMGVYFDVFDVVLKGLNKLSVELDVRGDALAFNPTILAQPDSELAAWLKVRPGSLDTVLPYASGDAPLVFAMRWDEASAFMPTLKRFLRLSMQMQGVPADSAAVTETEKLLDLMLPVKLAGSVGFQDGFTFGGVYQFPGRDVGEVYGLMKNYFTSSMQGQVGDDKIYKSVTLKEKARETAGLSVDRATIEFNLDAPIYQMPGQKEMIEGLWPGGKMEFDYAHKGDNLFIASPALLDGLLQPLAPQPAAPAGLTPNTVAYGRINVLRLVPAFLNANPMVPEETKQQLRNLDSTGTAVTFQVDIADNAVRAKETIPLKMLRSVGSMFP